MAKRFTLNGWTCEIIGRGEMGNRPLAQTKTFSTIVVAIWNNCVFPTLNGTRWSNRWREIVPRTLFDIDNKNLLFQGVNHEWRILICQTVIEFFVFGGELWEHCWTVFSWSWFVLKVKVENIRGAYRTSRENTGHFSNSFWKNTTQIRTSWTYHKNKQI